MANGEERSDTERKILDAAHAVCRRQGTAGARMQAIAEEAGVNKALLHYYFRSKENLTRAVFEDALTDLLPRIAGVLGGDAPLEEKVEAAVHEYTDFHRANPHLSGYVVCEMNHHPQRLKELVAAVKPHEHPGFEALATQLEARAEAGDIRPISPEQFMVNLVSLSLFPFVARPMLDVMLGIGEEEFEDFIEARRAQLPGFIMNALRP